MPRIEPIPWQDIPPDERRRMDHTIQHGGSPADKTATRILAYALHDHVPDDGDRHYNYPRHLLGGKLLEMLRIRSAQLGGCEPCMDARKVGDVTEDVVACLITPSLRTDLTERERRALEFLDLLATDHHRIDDAVYRGLAEVFTTAEIIELGQTCGHMIGTHRFIHTLDPYGDAPPVIRYDPAEVGVTWDELHSGEPAGSLPRRDIGEDVTNPNHAIVRRFIQAMSDGDISDKLVTDDFTVWIIGTDQIVDKESYVNGIAYLPRVFPNKLVFTIHSLTAEDDRVIAQFSGEGVTIGGQRYRNDYLYLFKIRDGKICFLAEYLNLDAMRSILLPAMMVLQGA